MPYRLDAMKEVFEEVTVLGKPMLFTPCRIERGTTMTAGVTRCRLQNGSW